MSWTYITSCISVDTFVEMKGNINKNVSKYILNAPKITGSEEDASVYLNLKSGFNISSWKRDRKKGGYIHYQSCIVISIQGDLRDRSKEQTQEEFKKFLEYIEKKYFIRDYSINIEES